MKHLEGIHPSTLVEEVLKYATSGTVLEIGAGSGRNSLFLAANGFEVLAVDSRQSTLETLAFAAKLAKLPVTIKQADTGTYRPSGHYDVVVATMVMHFLDQALLEATIRMIKSVTKPNGLNVLMIATDKDDSGERPHLFSSGVLPSYYADWQVLTEEEQLAAPYNMDQREFHRAGLMARNTTG